MVVNDWMVMDWWWWLIVSFYSVLRVCIVSAVFSNWLILSILICNILEFKGELLVPRWLGIQGWVVSRICGINISLSLCGCLADWHKSPVCGLPWNSLHDNYIWILIHFKHLSNTFFYFYLFITSLIYQSYLSLIFLLFLSLSWCLMTNWGVQKSIFCFICIGNYSIYNLISY